jgi:4-diphosphocytidyl-2C-methyl-D-erythritol kinase
MALLLVSQQLAQDWLSAGGSLSEELFANDFEAYVEASEPSVKLIKRVAKRSGCEFVFMSGSGSAFVGVLAVESDAELVVEQIKSELSQEFFVQSCKLICKV